jgi:hypothetical protein
MARGGRQKPPDGPIDLSGWRLDEAGRRDIVSQLRPVLRELARDLGAKTTGERREVLEALGVSAMEECGYIALWISQSTKARLN